MSPEEVEPGELPRRRRRRYRRPAPDPSQGSREAKRIATAILEVLAGERTPTEAAQAIGASLPRYYSLEASAIAGLVSSCEPRRSGPQSPDAEAARLAKHVAKLERDCARYQALARIAQRSVGLAATPAKKGRKKKRARVRAYKAIAAIGSEPGGEGDGERSKADGTEAGRAPGRLGSGEAKAPGDPRIDHG